MLTCYLVLAAPVALVSDADHILSHALSKSALLCNQLVAHRICACWTCA